MQISHYDAVVILNGGAKSETELYEDTKARVRAGIGAALEHHIEHVIMVGHESHQMRVYGLQDNPAADQLDIRVEDISHNTIENAHWVKVRLLQPEAWKRILLVTEKFHSERSKLTFDMVLGPEYTVTSLNSEVDYTAEQRAGLAEQEAYYTDLTKRKLADIGPQDDDKRLEMLQAKREVTSDHFPVIRI